MAHAAASSHPTLPELTPTQQKTYDWAEAIVHNLPETEEVNGKKNCIYWLKYYLAIVTVNLHRQPSELRITSNSLIIRGANLERRKYSPIIYSNALSRLAYYKSAFDRKADLERSVFHPLYIEWRNCHGMRLYLDAPPPRACGLLADEANSPPRLLNPNAAEFVHLAPEAAALETAGAEGVVPGRTRTPNGSAEAVQLGAEAADNTTEPEFNVALSVFRALFRPRNQIVEGIIRFTPPSWPPGWPGLGSPATGGDSSAITSSGATPTTSNNPPDVSSASSGPQLSPRNFAATLTMETQADGQMNAGDRVGEWIEASMEDVATAVEA
jgi:hypothetical protein